MKFVPVDGTRSRVNRALIVAARRLSNRSVYSAGR